MNTRDTEEIDPTQQEIERRAYELYLERGEEGHEMENWLLAEEELRKQNQTRLSPTKNIIPGSSDPIFASNASSSRRQAATAGKVPPK